MDHFRCPWLLPVILLAGVPASTLGGQPLRQAEVESNPQSAPSRPPQRLDPGLERQRAADRQRREQEERLQARLNRGVRHLADGHPEPAAEEFRAAVELEPARGATHALLAAALAAADHHAEAIEAYRRAIELEPAEAAHYNNLGIVLTRRGGLEEALPHFDRAAQLDPERAATYRYNRGAVLLNAGRLEEALPALRQAARSDPRLAVAHYFLGLALFRTSPRRSTAEGRERIEPRPGAVEAFQRYLKLAPDGDYADRARESLRQLGVAPPAMLLPAVTPPGVME